MLDKPYAQQAQSEPPQPAHVERVWPAALHLTARPSGGALGRSFARLFLVPSMHVLDARHFHEREAARLRRLLANATTPAVKGRLLEEAEQHERLAKPSKHRMDDQAAHSEREMAEP